MQRQKLMNWMLPTGPKEMRCVYFMDQLPLVRTEKYWRTSPVNIIGKIVDSPNKDYILNQIKDGTKSNH